MYKPELEHGSQKVLSWLNFNICRDKNYHSKINSYYDKIKNQYTINIIITYKLKNLLAVEFQQARQIIIILIFMIKW